MNKSKLQIVNESLLNDLTLKWLYKKINNLYLTSAPESIVLKPTGIEYKYNIQTEEKIDVVKENIFFRQKEIIDFYNEKFGNINFI